MGDMTVSRYRKVDPRIWNDEKFRALGDMGKLVFFMLLTHPSMTALGAMRATISGLAEELGQTPEAFRHAFEDVLHQGMAEHDPKACLIALPNFIRYNLPESPNVVKAWVGALDLIPECDLKTTVVQRAKEVAEGMGQGFRDAFRMTFLKGMPYPEQEQEPEQKNTQEGFTEFWAAWPPHKRKVARAQCVDKWVAKDCAAVRAEIMAALARAVASADWAKDRGQYIPAPLVWLNQARWEAPDEDALPATVATNPQVAETAARLAADEQRDLTLSPEAIAASKARVAALKAARLAPVAPDQGDDDAP